MTVQEIAQTPEYGSLVADYRSMCLWSAGDCARPKDVVQLDYILRCIETYGNADGFKRAGRIRKWL